MYAEHLNMPFQAKDGTWWSDDRMYYRSGNQWILYQGSASSQQSEASVQQPSAQSNGNQIGTTTPSTLAAALGAFPQSSTEPYRQQGQLLFGTNPQTPGRPAAPAIALDPNIRAAASRNMMIWGFVKSMDDISRGRSG